MYIKLVLIGNQLIDSCLFNCLHIEFQGNVSCLFFVVFLLLGIFYTRTKALEKIRTLVIIDSSDKKHENHVYLL